MENYHSIRNILANHQKEQIQSFGTPNMRIEKCHQDPQNIKTEINIEPKNELNKDKEKLKVNFSKLKRNI